MPLQTPQDKKQLSYRKDRRNAYGEHNKGSRHTIRRHKVLPRRASRRHVRQALRMLRAATVAPDSEDVDKRLYRQLPRVWKKRQDLPLGHFLVGRLARRARLGISAPTGVWRAVQRIRRHMPRAGKITASWSYVPAEDRPVSDG